MFSSLVNLYFVPLGVLKCASWWVEYLSKKLNGSSLGTVIERSGNIGIGDNASKIEEKKNL